MSKQLYLLINWSDNWGQLTFPTFVTILVGLPYSIVSFLSGSVIVTRILLFQFNSVLNVLQSTPSKTDTFGTGSKCPSQRDVHLIESQIKGVRKGRDQLQVSILQRCPSYRESNKGSKERQGPTLGVRFREVSVLQRCPLRESRLYLVLLPIHNMLLQSSEKDIKQISLVSTDHNKILVIFAGVSIHVHSFHRQQQTAIGNSFNA